MQAYLPHSAERIAASPIGMNLGTAERSVVHARRWLCRAAWMICTGIHSDAAATNGKGVPIALRVCGEVVVGQTESGGFDPFGRLDPTNDNKARGAMWLIGVNDKDCTPALVRAQGERRWRGGGPCAAQASSSRICAASIRSSSSWSPPSLTRSGARQHWSMRSGCGFCTLCFVGRASSPTTPSARNETRRCLRYRDPGLWDSRTGLAGRLAGMGGGAQPGKERAAGVDEAGV